MTDDLDVDRSDLEPVPLSDLPEGGQSDRISWVRDPDGSLRLLKEYPDEVLRPDTHDRLHELIRWRRSLAAADRHYVDSRTAWVRRVVVAGGRPAGVLIPPAPDWFWTWDAQGGVVPRSSVQLGVPEQRARPRGQEYYNVPRTVSVLGDLLSTMQFLHERDIAIGDLQRANVLVSAPSARPASYLVDCDSVLLAGAWTLRPAEQEIMKPDHVDEWPEVLNRRTDLYKFALISAGAIAKQLALVTVTTDVRNNLPADHGDLLRRMLTVDQDVPGSAHLTATARIWHAYVDAAGTEFHRTPTSLSRRPWTGEGSLVHRRGVPDSPAARIPRMRPATEQTTASAAAPPPRRPSPPPGPTPPRRPSSASGTTGRPRTQPRSKQSRRSKSRPSDTRDTRAPSPGGPPPGRTSGGRRTPDRRSRGSSIVLTIVIAVVVIIGSAYVFWAQLVQQFPALSDLITP